VIYIVIVLVVAVGGSVLFGAWHIHEETAPGERPSMAAARRVVRQSRLMANGDLCICGGTLEPNGQVSRRYGTLLGCSECPRRWTGDGRRVVQAAPRPRPRTRRTPVG
jgi:hypothetical protein